MLDVLSNLENLTSSINKTNVNYERANILLMQVTSIGIMLSIVCESRW